MTRTTTRRQREVKHFVTDNRRLFPFAGLFLLGVTVGVAVYLTAGDTAASVIAEAVTPHQAGWLAALWDCLFAPLCMLAALYLLGLWGCGAPFILAVPLIHGLGLGVTEAHLYTTGTPGVLTVACRVMPVGLLTAALLTMACAESLRLSVTVSRLLIPDDPHTLPKNGFRLYSLRFALFLGAAVVIALLDTGLRAIT
ncbi:MAG: hypothetical protein IIX28_04555 [Clostridia bacterium]|nr:hypothetical protein [Clostridia bacterium]